MIQLVSSSQEGAVIGDPVQVTEGGTLSVQATGTWQQTETTPEKTEKYSLLILKFETNILYFIALS